MHYATENEVPSSIGADMVHDKKDKWENITVAKNCPVDWNSMKGDEKIRFCGKCSQNVYNLSEMTREQAAAVIQEQGGDMCIRIYRRLDGTIKTSDCPEVMTPPSVYLPMLAAGLAVGGLAMYAGMSYVSSIQQGKMQFHQPQTTLPNDSPIKVVYIIKRLRAGEAITADAVQLRDVPRNKAPVDSLYNFNQVVGKVLNYDCEAGSLITEHALRK
jgi:hypothetical protein